MSETPVVLVMSVTPVVLVGQNEGGTENNQKNFKHQRNFCKKLLRTTKKSYYSTLDIKKLQITKPSGKQSYLFSQKGF